MSEDKLDLAVIIGSTREGRLGDRVARWFAAEAEKRSDFRVDLVDLAALDLPAGHPKQPTPAIERFRARLAVADAFAVVTPEYNHGYPAALKHAIDQVTVEWQAKPVGFVSYGGMSGGLRAVEQLRLVFAELHAVTMRNAVSFHMAWNRFDAAGQPKDSAGCAAAAGAMLDQLTWWAAALRNARNAAPYGRAAA